MSSVWISKSSWEKVWAAIHNIRVRMNFTVKEPSVSLSGQGASARINIDLPCPRPGDPGKIYDGPFAVSYSAGEKALVINGGWINVNGTLLSVQKFSFTEIREGELFLVITMDETGIVTAMKYQFGECDEKSYPVCRIRLTEEKIPVISMYHVPPVIPFIIAKECVFALKE